MHCLCVANHYELGSRVSVTGYLRLLCGYVLLADTKLGKTPEPDLGLGFKAHTHIHTCILSPTTRTSSILMYSL